MRYCQQSSKYSDGSCFKRIFTNAFAAVNNYRQLQNHTQISTSSTVENNLYLPTRKISSVMKLRNGDKKKKKKKKKKKRHRKTTMITQPICNQQPLICCTCHRQCLTNRPFVIRRTTNSMPVANLNICVDKRQAVPLRRIPTLKSVVRAKDPHKITEEQKQTDKKLSQAFGISDSLDYVFDHERRAKNSSIKADIVKNKKYSTLIPSRSQSPDETGKTSTNNQIWKSDTFFDQVTKKHKKKKKYKRRYGSLSPKNEKFEIDNTKHNCYSKRASYIQKYERYEEEKKRLSRSETYKRKRSSTSSIDSEAKVQAQRFDSRNECLESLNENQHSKHTLEGSIFKKNDTTELIRKSIMGEYSTLVLTTDKRDEVSIKSKCDFEDKERCQNNQKQKLSTESSSFKDILFRSRRSSSRGSSSIEGKRNVKVENRVEGLKKHGLALSGNREALASYRKGSPGIEQKIKSGKKSNSSVPHVRLNCSTLGKYSEKYLDIDLPRDKRKENANLGKSTPVPISSIEMTSVTNDKGRLSEITDSKMKVESGSRTATDLIDEAVKKTASALEADRTKTLESLQKLLFTSLGSGQNMPSFRSRSVQKNRIKKRPCTCSSSSSSSGPLRSSFSMSSSSSNSSRRSQTSSSSYSAACTTGKYKINSRRFSSKDITKKRKLLNVRHRSKASNRVPRSRSVSKVRKKKPSNREMTRIKKRDSKKKDCVSDSQSESNSSSTRTRSSPWFPASHGRRESPTFFERRIITSARKMPVPYKKSAVLWSLTPRSSSSLSSESYFRHN